jgi:hypothetical protein
MKPSPGNSASDFEFRQCLGGKLNTHIPPPPNNFHTTKWAIYSEPSGSNYITTWKIKMQSGKGIWNYQTGKGIWYYQIMGI